MAIKKYTSRKTTRKPRRKQFASRALVRRPLNLYSFKRFHFKLLQGGGDGAAYTNALTFQLSDVPNHTEFTNLFDQFKITGIKYRWVVTRNPDYGGGLVSGVPNASYTGSYPRIMWVHDFDSTSVPANFAELQQYPNMKEIYLNDSKPVTRWYYLKPARLAVEYETAVLSAYRPTWKGFIDCASDATQHYGLRYYMDGLAANVQVRLECWYMMAFKNVR